MKGLKKSAPGQRANKKVRILPDTFIFFDKGSGARRFEVRAQADGSLPVDEVLSLLVVQCVLRGQRPEDLALAITSSEDVLDGVRQRARKLIATCRFIKAVELTSRQQEVVRGVLEDLSNKELGDKMNLTVRTVKFHVTRLLRKFEVANRAGLRRRVAEMVSAGKLALPGLPDAGAGAPGGEVRNSREIPMITVGAEKRFRGLTPVLTLAGEEAGAHRRARNAGE